MAHVVLLDHFYLQAIVQILPSSEKILRWRLTLKKDLELKLRYLLLRERGRFCGSSFDTVC